jgi:hypothetical protein
MVTPRVKETKVPNSEDPLPYPPPNTFPQPELLYRAPLKFSGESSYYSVGGNESFVFGFVYPANGGQQRGESKDQFYDFSLPASPGPALVKLQHGWSTNGAIQADTYEFRVYILTPPS